MGRVIFLFEKKMSFFQQKEGDAGDLSLDFDLHLLDSGHYLRSLLTKIVILHIEHC